ncbi:Alpha/Beta hydrolase protein [Massariosphaeria phaeospora]|uniref:Dipeptidyl-peptidase V n=1 Tax=Massariosphaeria phaeospora TaxID=100035 RepID=A0A7C8I0Z7_9PLEO|nr:Alpha/Beta hydrolase protein [Massariosphaeria phaeospora]
MARYLGIAAALAATGALAITPEQMISAPRRSVASPNPSGKLALISTSQYSFEEESTSSVWQLLDLATGELTDSKWNATEVSEVVFLPGTETGILYINATNEQTPGGVSLWVGDVLKPAEGTLVASLDAPFSGLKVAKTSSGNLHFLVNSLAYQNGTAFNPELVPTPPHTGRLYENVYTRHWDKWLTKERYAVFGGSLLANSSYSLAHSGLRNLLQGIKFTATRPESPVQPFGGSGDYDISPDGSVFSFLSKAPHLNKANYTASYIYLGAFDGSEVATAFNGPESEVFKAGHQGASGQPTFSPDSSKLAYVQQDGDYYESDRWKLYTLDISSSSSKLSTSNWKGVVPKFDRSVASIHWAPNGESLFITAEDYAIERAFHIPLSADESFIPKNLTSVSSVSGLSVLPDSSLLVSANSIWSSRDYYILSGNGTQNVLFSSTKADEELAGLGPHTFSEIFYDGSLPDFDQQLHALVVKPSNFVQNKTYPLAYIIHGGPQGSNGNLWSTRWNFQVWADQGYIVVAPNPTGSTGFGQYLTDAIQGNWGGNPYDDVVLGWEYVKKNLAFADTKNGICAGASYGGYMTNWIQGHDLGNEFKALVTHDGLVNTLASWSSEELWFMRHDYNGTIGDEYTTYDKYNPMNHIANWSTPQFVVHNTLDYRLAESDGLELFNILQAKGIPSRFLNFPNENHHVLKPANSLFWHQEIFNWINHYAHGEKFDEVPIGE